MSSLCPCHEAHYIFHRMQLYKMRTIYGNKIEILMIKVKIDCKPSGIYCETKLWFVIGIYLYKNWRCAVFDEFQNKTNSENKRS